MLDKTIPYHHIIMRRGAETGAVKPPVLPEGYSVRTYQDGDEVHWARIETSVLEFEDEAQALERYAQKYLLEKEALRERCFFVVDAEGVPVATATAWFERVPGEGEEIDLSVAHPSDEKLERAAVMHWVAVCPSHQKLGLGRAVVSAALAAFERLEPGKDVWLHTQTWSHTAVRLYDSLGFRMQRVGRFMQKREEGWLAVPNEYGAAIGALQGVVELETLVAWTARAQGGEEKRVSCGKCGYALRETEAYCARCGALSPILRNSPERKGKISIPLSKMMPVGAAFIGLGVVMMVLTVVLLRKFEAFPIIVGVVNCVLGVSFFRRYQEALATGRKVVAVAEKYSEAAKAVECRYCGKGLDTESRFCTFCGSKVSGR